MARILPEEAFSIKPLYQQIVQTLQREIVTGFFPVGAVLPSEAVLSQRFDVSRHTVREALRALRDSGLVASRKGLGTIVQRLGQERGYVHEINTISDLFPANVETLYEPVTGGLLSLPRRSEILPGGEGADLWLKIQGVRRHPGAKRPFDELEVYVAARFAGVGRLVGAQPGPIYGIIEALYGELIGQVDQLFRTFECNGRVGSSLGLKRGDIGIEVRRIYRLAAGREIAMISFNRYLPKAFNFSMTLRRLNK